MGAHETIVASVRWCACAAHARTRAAYALVPFTVITLSAAACTKADPVGSIGERDTGLDSLVGTGGADGAGLPTDAASDDPAPPSDDSATADPRADFQAMIARYKSWSSPNPEPIDVSSYIFALCRAPSPLEKAFSTSEHGNRRSIREWDNDLARASLGDSGKYPFGPGAAIVKEKLVRDDGGFSVVALGLMFKRGPGFDAAHGDWDFAYWEEGSGLLNGAVQSAHCGDCHTAARDTDFVFAAGLIPGK
jgi:hypothetical protein